MSTIWLSSRSTVFLRIGLPLFLLAVCAYAGVDPDIEIGIKECAFMLAGAGGMFFINRPLRRVRVADGALWVSRWRAETRVPLRLIDSVTQEHANARRTVTVTLREIVDGEGQSIVFLPRHNRAWGFWRDDPIVEDLRRWAGLGAPGA